ncbi:hypothetical protein VB834_24155 [Limnoraphis robusta Tam1]|uniref:hypothetical protein n=1 Tax=Limnoraphis robusta TaxID=1118279 RepID=UPI002B207248|nr:hypothetical protein [Limnoraphis robusta]MEA5542131.1 hypothetical protein [Limnoraphis robusta Tam1]
MPIKYSFILTSPKVLIVTILIGLITGCRNSIVSNILPLAEAKTQSKSIVTASSWEATNELNDLNSLSEPVTDNRTKNNNHQLQAALPNYCSPDEYKSFFEHFARGQDYQGNETRFTYTADTIEVRDYENPSILIEVISKKDDEFSIDLRDYRWVQLVPSTVDNSPYTRLQIYFIRFNNNTFRVDYIKAEYAYDPQVGEEEYLVRTYGEPGAYIFEHRNGCWNLTQKLQ